MHFKWHKNVNNEYDATNVYNLVHWRLLYTLRRYTSTTTDEYVHHTSCHIANIKEIHENQNEKQFLRERERESVCEVCNVTCQNYLRESAHTSMCDTQSGILKHENTNHKRFTKAENLNVNFQFVWAETKCCVRVSWLCCSSSFSTFLHSLF